MRLAIPQSVREEGSSPYSPQILDWILFTPPTDLPFSGTLSQNKKQPWRVWPKKAVEETTDTKRGQGVSAGNPRAPSATERDQVDKPGIYKFESNGVANGIAAKRCTEVSDKKMD
ncbi:UPF0729 protein C18orf32 homolog isoform 2-T2 [Podargus strigoides]